MSRKRPVFILAAVAAMVALPVYSAFGRAGESAPPGDQRVLAQTALGDSFTYQGRLTESNQPANGVFDFQFTIYGAASGSAQVCTTAANDVKERGDVQVTNGLFTVDLDFCPEAFSGSARWLEIGVRPGTSTGTYTILSPRQPISPAPHALYAKRAGGFVVPFTGSGATTGTAALLALTQTGTAATTYGLTVEGATGTGAKLAGDAASLELDGPLRVSGTKTAFTVVVDTTGADANVCGPAGAPTAVQAVEIPSTVANASTDLIFVTPSVLGANSGGFGVAFNAGGDCAVNQWVIYSLDDTVLLDGLTFNVLVIKQ